MDFGEKKKKKEEESRSTGIPPLCELIRRLPALSIKCSAQSLTKCRFLTTFASFLSYLAFLIPLKIEMAASTGYHESLHFRKKNRAVGGQKSQNSNCPRGGKPSVNGCSEVRPHFFEHFNPSDRLFVLLASLIVAFTTSQSQASSIQDPLPPAYNTTKQQANFCQQ